MHLGPEFAPEIENYNALRYAITSPVDNDFIHRNLFICFDGRKSVNNFNIAIVSLASL